CSLQKLPKTMECLRFYLCIGQYGSLAFGRLRKSGHHFATENRACWHGFAGFEALLFSCLIFGNKKAASRALRQHISRQNAMQKPISQPGREIIVKQQGLDCRQGKLSQKRFYAGPFSAQQGQTHSRRLAASSESLRTVVVRDALRMQSLQQEVKVLRGLK